MDVKAGNYKDIKYCRVPAPTENALVVHRAVATMPKHTLSMFGLSLLT